MLQPTPLVSAPDAPVEALAAQGDWLVAGGLFTAFEGRLQPRLALFRKALPPAEPGPQALCRDLALLRDSSGVARISPDEVYDGDASDPRIAWLSLDRDSFGCDSETEAWVTLTLLNTDGDTSSCQALISLEYLMPLSLECPPDISVPIDAGGCAAQVFYPLPMPSDTCRPSRLELTEGPGTGAFFSLGNTLVVYTLFSDTLVAATCSLQVQVHDSLPPPVLSFAVVPASAPDSANGSIEVLVSGGRPPFAYMWNTGDSSALVSGLPAGLYTVRVSDSLGCTFEASDSVTALPAPCPVPEALSTLIISPTRALLSWSFVPEAVLYNVRGRREVGTFWENLFPVSTSVIIPELNPAMNYVWQVRSVCSESSISEYSELVTFNTMTPSDERLTDTGAESLGEGIQLWPVPASDVLHLRWAAAGEGRLRISDLSGRVIWESLHPAGRADESASLAIPTGEWADGWYRVSLWLDGAPAAEKNLIILQNP
jgi:hypothetical protein